MRKTRVNCSVTTISIIGIALYFVYSLGFFNGDTLYLSFDMKAPKETNVQLASPRWDSQVNASYNTPNDWQTLQLPINFNPAKLIFKPSFVEDNSVSIRNLRMSKGRNQNITIRAFSIEPLDRGVTTKIVSDEIFAYNPSGFTQFFLVIDSDAKPGSDTVFKFKQALEFWPITFYLLIFCLLFFGVLNKRHFQDLGLKFGFVLIIQSILVLAISHLTVRLFSSNYQIEGVIGKSSFLGFNPLLMPTLTLAIAGIYFISSWVISLRLISLYSKPSTTLHARKNKKISSFFFVLMFFWCSLNRLSNNVIGFHAQFDAESGKSWDLENIQTWNALLHLGLKPNVDFWYPYGARIFLNYFPVFTSIIECLLLGLLSFFILNWLWEHSNSNLMPTVVANLMLYSSFHLTTDAFRIVLPLVSFAWLSRLRIEGFRWHLQLILIGWVMISFGSDTYSSWVIGTLALVFFQALKFASSSQLSEQIAKIASKIALILVLQTCLLLILNLIPFYQTIIEMLLHSREYLISSSEPMNLNSYQWRVWLISILLLGIVLLVFAKLDKHLTLLPVAAATTMAAFVHLSKSATRFSPWLNNIDFLFLLTMCMSLLLSTNLHLKLRPKIYLFLGVFILILYTKPTYAFDYRLVVSQLQTELEWRPPHKNYRDLLLSKYDVRGTLETQSKQTIYVFGDSGMNYVGLRQKPFWQINLYNSGTMIDSKRVLNEIELRPPDVIHVVPADLEFDLVPAYIRNYAIVEMLVKNWIPYGQNSIGDWLIRKLPEETTKPERLNEWASVFGSHINLGFVPLHLVGSKHDLCTNMNNYCGFSLQEISGALTRSKVIDFHGRAFTLTLNVENPKSNFAFPYKFLWFNSI